MRKSTAQKQDARSAEIIAFRARGSAAETTASLPAVPDCRGRPAPFAPMLRDRLAAAVAVSVALHGLFFTAYHWRFIDDLERTAGAAATAASEGAELLVPVDIVMETPLPAAPAPTHAARAEEKAIKPAPIEAKAEPKSEDRLARAEAASDPPKSSEITASIEAMRPAMPEETATEPRPVVETASTPEAPVAMLVIVEPQRHETAESHAPPAARSVSREPRKTAHASPSTAAAPARAAASATPGRAGASGAVATGGSAAVSSYRARVLAHLSRYKTYPPEAQSRGITGVATVRFALASDGRVLSAALARGSGASVLDDSAVAMVRRASPFPPFPPDLNRARLDFAAPVRFEMR